MISPCYRFCKRNTYASCGIRHDATKLAKVVDVGIEGEWRGLRVYRGRHDVGVIVLDHSWASQDIRVDSANKDRSERILNAVAKS